MPYPQVVPFSKVVQKANTPSSSLGCREAESPRDQRAKRSGFSFPLTVPSTAMSHSSHPSPCDGRWGAYSEAAVIWSGRYGRAVPEQLLMTEGMRTRRSDRVAGMPTTREKRADKVRREDRNRMSLRRAKACYDHCFSNLTLNTIAGRGGIERTPVVERPSIILRRDQRVVWE